MKMEVRTVIIYTSYYLHGFFFKETQSGGPEDCELSLEGIDDEEIDTVNSSYRLYTYM